MPSPTRVLQEVRRFIAAARPDGDSDRILIERFTHTRDERAFGELVRRHGPMVLGVCRRVLRHAADAEDAFQATFLILVRRAADLRDPDRLGSWLYGVAWRTANKLRTTRRPGMPLPDELAATTPNRDWPVELDAAIAHLPEKYRTPIVLCHLQGLSPSEVAGRLGCPPATVVTRLFRARQTLRRRLTALGLSIPPALVAGSVLEVPSALATAVGEMAAGRTIPPAAARLADGVFRSLLMTRIRWAMTAAVVCLGGVGVFGFRAGGQEPIGPPPTERVAPEVSPPPISPPLARVPDEPPADRVEQMVAISTTNFHVSAPSARIARLIGDVAERARKDVAVAWLGKELAPWPKPWPIRVTLGKGSGGATVFDFTERPIHGEMNVEGELDRLLADVVPHEVTHCVMADYFKAPVPRWADEGMSILNESEEERSRYPQVTRDILNAGRGKQLKALFPRRDYPANDVLAFFAQSYSVTAFLVEKKDRPTFVKFVADGMKEEGWDAAAKTHYGFANLNDLERAWIDSLKAATRNQIATAHRPASNPSLVMASADPDGRVTIYMPTHAYEAVTSYELRESVEVKDGKRQVDRYVTPVTSNQLRVRITPQTFRKGEVRAFDTDGKEIAEPTMLASLKEHPAPVVVTTEATGLDRVFASLLKPGTIILVPPPKPAPAAPPTAPTVGR